MWIGVAGEEQLKVNDCCLMYQKTLLNLYKQGVILCLCSKNDESNTNNAFDTLNMKIGKEAFVIKKVNWNNKATNIKLISEELNLSTSSFVFVDDSDYEIELVKSFIPDVKTIKSNTHSISWIKQVSCFFDLSVNTEKNRNILLIEQKNREKERIIYDSISQFNKAIHTKIKCNVANITNINRISELSNRTNKFNLSMKRYSISELNDLIDNPDYLILTASLEDKFGDMGIIGCAIVLIKDRVINDFMISCRAFDRNVENCLIDKIKMIVGDDRLKGVMHHCKENDRYSSFYKDNDIVPIL
jgi:FkbH-like protein